MATEREPIWTAQNINRKTGDTDFEQCGWCRHASGGTGRYSCMISTSCSLLPSWPRRDTEFDTPCLLKSMGKADIESAAQTKRNEAQSHRDSAIKCDTQAVVLLKLAAHAEPIPIQPDRRDACHFNAGDRLRAFWDGKWHSGVCVPGYRHHEGCVSLVQDLDNTESGCGNSVPTIMLESEFQYFKERPEVFAAWLARCDREDNGVRLDMAAMKAAMEAAR